MNGKGLTTQGDLDTYIQLMEIRVQLHYLKEYRLASQVQDRLDDLYVLFDAGEHKELAIMIANLVGS